MAGELGPITLTDVGQLTRELHSAAIALGDAKRRHEADPSAQNLQALQTLYEHFRRVNDAYHRAAGAGAGLTAMDKLILSTGSYIEAAVKALPRAIAAVPQAVTSGLLRGLWPWALGGAALWWFTAGPGLRAGTRRMTW